MAVKRRLSVPLPRKDGGRVFVKRPDPHEEALTILRGQMSPPVAAPGTQVRGWGWWGHRAHFTQPTGRPCRGRGEVGGREGVRTALLA